MEIYSYQESKCVHYFAIHDLFVFLLTLFIL